MNYCYDKKNSLYIVKNRAFTYEQYERNILLFGDKSKFNKGYMPDNGTICRYVWQGYDDHVEQYIYILETFDRLHQFTICKQGIDLYAVPCRDSEI